MTIVSNTCNIPFATVWDGRHGESSILTNYTTREASWNTLRSLVNAGSVGPCNYLTRISADLHTIDPNNVEYYRPNRPPLSSSDLNFTQYIFSPTHVYGSLHVPPPGSTYYLRIHAVSPNIARQANTGSGWFLSIGTSPIWFLSGVTGLGDTPFILVEATFYRSVLWQREDLLPWGDFPVETEPPGEPGTPKPGRPADWQWTEAELNAMNNYGPFATVTWQRWNAFLTRINDFCAYAEVAYLPVEVYRSEEDKMLYAVHFVTIAEKIHQMSEQVPDYMRQVQTNDRVLGAYFITLSNALNSIQVYL